MHIFGSIETTGNTIAVLPSGLNNIYPKKNIELYNQILKNNGLVLSEYNENVEANSKRFLERNRIVSGLAIGTLVVEGGYRSGTNVTARLTKEQGKKVFCIPSNLDNSKGITPNKLIREGAILVTKVDDIIEEYPEIHLKNNLRKDKVKLDDSVSEEYKDIYNILDEDKLIHINEIVKKLKLNVTEINYKLMMLELEDKIVSLPGNNYKKK